MGELVQFVLRTCGNGSSTIGMVPAEYLSEHIAGTPLCNQRHVWTAGGAGSGGNYERPEFHKYFAQSTIHVTLDTAKGELTMVCEKHEPTRSEIHADGCTFCFTGFPADAFFVACVYNHGQMQLEPESDLAIG